MLNRRSLLHTVSKTLSDNQKTIRNGICTVLKNYITHIQIFFFRHTQLHARTHTHTRIPNLISAGDETTSVDVRILQTLSNFIMIPITVGQRVKEINNLLPKIV